MNSVVCTVMPQKATATIDLHQRKLKESRVYENLEAHTCSYKYVHACNMCTCTVLIRLGSLVDKLASDS